MKQPEEKNVDTQELFKFMDFYATHVDQINSDVSYHPSNSYKKILAEKGEKIAVSGLKMAVNDIVSDSFSYSREDVKKIDDFFIANGVLSLTHMRKMFSSKYKKILKNKKIKNIEEYYLVKDILDSDVMGLNDEERLALEMIKEVFESTEKT